MVARIFLCHASEDKAQVREVYRRLAAIQGFEPWLDEEDLFRGRYGQMKFPVPSEPRRYEPRLWTTLKPSTT